jgi:hypothetical protein
VYEDGHLARLLERHAIAMPGGAPPTTTIQFLRDGALHPLDLRASGIARTKLLSVRGAPACSPCWHGSRRSTRHASSVAASPTGSATSRDDVARLVQSFVRLGSYVHAPDRFDAGAAIAQLQLGRRGVRYLDGGWGRMAARMAGAAMAAGATVVPGVAVERVTTDGRDVAGDHL